MALIATGGKIPPPLQNKHFVLGVFLNIFTKAFNTVDCIRYYPGMSNTAIL